MITWMQRGTLIILCYALFTLYSRYSVWLSHAEFIQSFHINAYTIYICRCISCVCYFILHILHFCICKLWCFSQMCVFCLRSMKVLITTFEDICVFFLSFVCLFSLSVIWWLNAQYSEYKSLAATLAKWPH